MYSNGFVRADALDENYRELQELQEETMSKGANIFIKDRNAIVSEIQPDRELLGRSRTHYIATRIDYLNQEISETQRAVAEIKERLVARKTAFDARLVSMYKSRNVSYIEVLLQFESLSIFGHGTLPAKCSGTRQRPIGGTIDHAI